MDFFAADVFIGTYITVSSIEDTGTFLHEDDDVDRSDAVIRKIFSLVFSGHIILAYQQVSSIAEASFDRKVIPLSLGNLTPQIPRKPNELIF